MADHASAAEGFPLRCEDIQTVFACGHQADDAGLRQVVVIHRRKDGRVNFPFRHGENPGSGHDKRRPMISHCIISQEPCFWKYVKRRGMGALQQLQRLS